MKNADFIEYYVLPSRQEGYQFENMPNLVEKAEIGLLACSFLNMVCTETDSEKLLATGMNPTEVIANRFAEYCFIRVGCIHFTWLKPAGK